MELWKICKQPLPMNVAGANQALLLLLLPLLAWVVLQVQDIKLCGSCMYPIIAPLNDRCGNEICLFSSLVKLQHDFTSAWLVCKQRPQMQQTQLSTAAL